MSTGMRVVVLDGHVSSPRITTIRSVAGQSLVDAVVHHLVEVMKPRTAVSPMYMAGQLPDRVHAA